MTDRVTEWVAEKLAARDRDRRSAPGTTCVLWEVAETIEALRAVAVAARLFLDAYGAGVAFATWENGDGEPIGHLYAALVAALEHEIVTGDEDK